MWYAKKAGNDFQGIVIEEATGRTVAVSYEAHDAALLAAAPDLLLAITRLADIAVAPPGWSVAEHSLSLSVAIKSASAAIAKAKGE